MNIMDGPQRRELSSGSAQEVDVQSAIETENSRNRGVVAKTFDLNMNIWLEQIVR